MGKPIRVLQIATQMNRAGLESRLMDIYRTIDKNRVQFDFYTCRKQEGFYDKEIFELGGKVFYSEPITLKNAFWVPSRFRVFLNDHMDYNIIHCHLNQWCGIILKGAKQSNISVRIAHSRTSLEMKSVKNIVKNIVKQSANKYATHKFAVSKKAGIWLFGKKALENKEIIIWPNAINCNKFRYSEATRKKYREDLNLGNAFTLIHVGNLRPEKNHKFLLDVFSVLKHKVADSKLILIGADYMSGEIQRYSEKIGIAEDVLFLGARSDIAGLLQAGDVFVFPSLYEGFPGAVLEAEAAGLPCIISDSITNEVCITSDIHQLSLSLSKRVWSEKILECATTERKDVYDIICAAGYDINILTEKMEEFYENINLNIRGANLI